MIDLKDTIVLDVEGAKIPVKFPTMGQIMDIDSMKMIYSSRQYGALVQTPTNSAQFALDLIDAISHLHTLCPDLMSKLGMEKGMTIEECSPLLGKKLVKVYKDQFKPWYDPFIKELYSDMFDDEEEQESDKKDSQTGN